MLLQIVPRHGEPGRRAIPFLDELDRIQHRVRGYQGSAPPGQDVKEIDDRPFGEVAQSRIIGPDRSRGAVGGSEEKISPLVDRPVNRSVLSDDTERVGKLAQAAQADATGAVLVLQEEGGDRLASSEGIVLGGDDAGLGAEPQADDIEGVSADIDQHPLLRYLRIEIESGCCRPVEFSPFEVADRPQLADRPLVDQLLDFRHGRDEAPGVVHRQGGPVGFGERDELPNLRPALRERFLAQRVNAPGEKFSGDRDMKMMRDCNDRPVDRPEHLPEVGHYRSCAEPISHHSRPVGIAVHEDETLVDRHDLLESGEIERFGDGPAPYQCNPGRRRC